MASMRRNTGKKARQVGKKRIQRAQYFETRWPLKKLRRVIRASGWKAGLAWAQANDALSALGRLERLRNAGGQPLVWLAKAKEKAERNQAAA